MQVQRKGNGVLSTGCQLGSLMPSLDNIQQERQATILISLLELGVGI